MKDYYQILGVPPSATLADIKIAYRKLAHTCHPDKNPSDTYAAARFNLIKEAYDTLTRPELKAQYLQERWLSQSMGAPVEKTATTPPQILKAVLAAHQQLIHYDEYRVDKKGLYETLLALIAPSGIEILNQFNQQDINREVVKWMTHSLFLLYPQDQLQMLVQLKKVSAPPESKVLIANKEAALRRTIRFNRYKPFLILGLIILLCIIIAYSL
ncbi:J domain-containing protein [Niabella drilacis]|uniref:DnaJ domain-containing protein n=1 Tax=Niabella drilacis (strain DSM 25811 / CCM 8410 / CCUG 62505 / LMG 26954 / E90) TaxID=1285928 RepID=A0A1G6V843_NIADE|nr:J domain-containing protein [Niabella drilacis]SDD48995.1 DnaJ domain-containing protein [Niabella drilacis]